MSTIGQKERKTQQLVVKLFCGALGYGYLGYWEEREGNRNIETELLRAWLKRQGHADAISGKVLSDMDAELAALEQRRAKTRALKQGMMQELLTGRTRLVEGGGLRVEN